jgi:hypothetical protein
VKKKTPSLKVLHRRESILWSPSFGHFSVLCFPCFLFLMMMFVPRNSSQARKSAFQIHPMRFVIDWFAMSVVFGKCNRWLMTKAPSLAEFAHVYNKESNKQKMKTSNRMNDWASASVNKHKPSCYPLIV